MKNYTHVCTTNRQERQFCQLSVLSEMSKESPWDFIYAKCVLFRSQNLVHQFTCKATQGVI